MTCGPKARGRLHVPGLIVKEEIGLELLQKWPLAQSAQKHRLIDYQKLSAFLVR